MIKGKSPISFEEHLNQYDIFKFDSFDELSENTYSKWPSPTEEEIELLNNRENADASSSFIDNLNFYNKIASSEILRSTILSEKYGAYPDIDEIFLSCTFIFLSLLYVYS